MWSSGYTCGLAQLIWNSGLRCATLVDPLVRHGDSRASAHSDGSAGLHDGPDLSVTAPDVSVRSHDDHRSTESGRVPFVSSVMEPLPVENRTVVARATR